VARSEAPWGRGAGAEVCVSRLQQQALVDAQDMLQTVPRKPPRKGNAAGTIQVWRARTIPAESSFRSTARFPTFVPGRLPGPPVQATRERSPN
jgi:hypothetical protein